MTTPAAVLMAVGLVSAEFPTAAPVPASKPKADGLIAVNCGDHLRLLNEADREVKRYTPPKAGGWPAWQIGPISPDGTRVLLSATLDDAPTRYTRAVVAPLDGEGPLQRIPVPGYQFGSLPFWSPGGKKLIDSHHVYDGAFGVSSHALNLAIDVSTGQPEVMPLPAIPGGQPEGVARFRLADPNDYRRSLHRVVDCSPAGDWYLTWQQEREGFSAPRWLALVSKDGKTVRRVLSTDHFAQGRFSPDGKRAVMTVWSRSEPVGERKQFDGVFVLTVMDNILERVVAPPSDLVQISWIRAAWSPDGKRIAVGYHCVRVDGYEFRVVSYTPDGGDPRTVLSVIGTKGEVAPLRLDGWY
jgi:hypothetical protein